MPILIKLKMLSWLCYSYFCINKNFIQMYFKKKTKNNKAKIVHLIPKVAHCFYTKYNLC